MQVIPKSGTPKGDDFLIPLLELYRDSCQLGNKQCDGSQENEEVSMSFLN